MVNKNGYMASLRLLLYGF